MTTTLRKELTYDAPVEEVAAMLVDPAFREQVLRAQEWDRSSVRVEGSVVRIEMVGSTEGVSSVMRKLVGEEIEIVREETWTGPAHADVHVSVTGKPAEVTGSAALAESGATTTETIELEVRVSIPLVGGKIEKGIADMLGKALDDEHRAGVAWLAR